MMNPSTHAPTRTTYQEDAGFRSLRAVVGQPPAAVGSADRFEAYDEEEAARSERLAARLSVTRSRDRIAAALAVPCIEHGAEVGAFCHGDARSTVRGMCASRFARGARAAAQDFPALDQAGIGSSDHRPAFGNPQLAEGLRERQERAAGRAER